MADAETVRLGAVHSVDQAKLRQPVFQEMPCLFAVLLGAAFRLGLIAAQEDMAADTGEIGFLGNSGKVLHWPTITAWLANSPISGTRMVTTSPGASAPSCGTMMPVPVSSTVPHGTWFARVRNWISVSMRR